MENKQGGAGQGGLNPAEATDLNGLVDYAAGAIVSKTIVKNGVGNVTLFSFDKGQGLSEHTAPFDALVQIVDGAAEITIGGKAVHAEAGSLVLMPAGIPHALQAETRFKMMLVMIRG